MLIQQKTDVRRDPQSGAELERIPRGALVVTSDDKIGRADARLVSLISRINRQLKGNGIDSLYHSDDVYKNPTTVLKFNWSDRDKVAQVARMNNFAVEVDE